MRNSRWTSTAVRVRSASRHRDYGHRKNDASSAFSVFPSRKAEKTINLSCNKWMAAVPALPPSLTRTIFGTVQFSSVHSFILIRKSFSTWADLPGNRIQGNDSKRRKEKNDNIYNYNYITSKSVHRVLIEIVLQAQFKDRGIITPSYDCRKRIP